MSARTNPAKADVRQQRRWRIGFLIHLAETNVATLLAPESSGDLLNIARDILRAGLLLPPKQAPLDLEMNGLAAWLRTNPTQLEAAISALRKLLAAVADAGQFEWTFAQGSKVRLSGVALKAYGQGLAFSSPSSPPSAADQAIVLAAMLTLSSHEGAMVRRCARADCPGRRVFLATRPKQIFCSRSCASNAVFERYKQRQIKELGEEEYRAKHARSASASAKRRRLKKSKSNR